MSRKFRIWLMLSPALLVILAFFVGALLLALGRSLNYMPVIGLEEPNFDAYIAIFSDLDFLRSLLLSFHIAFTSTVLATVLAVASALLLRQSFHGKKVVTFLFQLNLTIPHIVGAVAILLLLSQSGFLARIAHAFGLIDRPAEFPALVFDPLALGVIAQYVWKEVPFIGVVTLAILQSLGDDYEASAMTLGANRWQRFRYVLLPLIAPGVLRASIIVFAFSFGAFELPFLLGQTYPAALPVLAYRSYTNIDLAARPEAMAMATVIAVISGILIYFYMRLSKRYTGRA